MYFVEELLECWEFFVEELLECWVEGVSFLLKSCESVGLRVILFFVEEL